MKSLGKRTSPSDPAPFRPAASFDLANWWITFFPEIPGDARGRTTCMQSHGWQYCIGVQQTTLFNLEVKSKPNGTSITIGANFRPILTQQKGAWIILSHQVSATWTWFWHGYCCWDLRVSGFRKIESWIFFTFWLTFGYIDSAISNFLLWFVHKAIFCYNLFSKFFSKHNVSYSITWFQKYSPNFSFKRCDI